MSNLFSEDELRKEIDEGYVSLREHPDYNLHILNYTPKSQFEHHWNDVTMACRGLIRNNNGNVVARPWNKFFNLGERNQQFQFDEKVEVYDKLDGSLGILYPTPDGYAVSTRGSFASDQAIHATEVFRNKYSDTVVPGDYTFLFEIIYKSNRIVLDYGDMDDLVLLGAVHTENGYYYGSKMAQALLEWSGPVAEQLPIETLSEALEFTDRPNAEGFVVKYHNTLVKVKQPDYLVMHRLRFNMTPLSIWANLMEGTDVADIVSPLPDEFQDEILDIAAQLNDQFTVLNKEIVADWRKVEHLKDDRKSFAQAVSGMKHRGPLFSLLDGRGYSEYIWKQIRPDGGVLQDADA